MKMFITLSNLHHKLTVLIKNCDITLSYTKLLKICQTFRLASNKKYKRKI